MAERPIFFVDGDKVGKKNISFEWFAGFAVSQKRKSIASLHEAAKRRGALNPLEISTKGTDILGVKLSAFSLKLSGIPLENIFQSSKVFVNGGPYRDLLNVSPRDAKRDPRLKSSGQLKNFEWNGETWELWPTTAFYDYIYCKAVKESLTREEINSILKYDAFTDIEFNPQKSINTQARTVAFIQVLLKKFGEIPNLSKEEFCELHKTYVKS